jgi:hypothetical protein
MRDRPTAAREIIVMDAQSVRDGAMTAWLLR